MYTSVRRYSGNTNLADALVSHEQDVRRLISAIDGFRAYYLVKTTDGNAVSISVYDDQSGAEESNRQAADWIRSNLPDLAVSPPQVSAGEVVINF